MKKLNVAVILVTVLLSNVFLVAGQNNQSVKAEVEKRLREHKEKVVIEMIGGVKLKGRLTEAAADTFTLMPDKTSQPTTIAYRDAARVKGTGLGRGAKIGIVAAVGGAVIGLILFLTFQHITRNN